MNDNYFNTNIIRNHDDIMRLNAWMVDHLNFMLTISWLNDSERSMYEDEIASYLCYDI